MGRVSHGTKEATREKLLASAAKEFGRVGLDRANVDAISVRAGYAKGTIYNYFSSKEDLFLAVIDSALTEATASVRDASEKSPREQIAATVGAFCEWVRGHDAFARVLVRECLMGTPSLYPRVITSEAPLVDELRSILADAAGRGEVRNDVSPDLLALAIAGLTDLALVQHWASGRSAVALNEVPELVVSLLLGTRASGGATP
jgi:AcrR family transcriptional regulator